jgi:hypothetical protein
MVRTDEATESTSTPRDDSAGRVRIYVSYDVLYLVHFTQILQHLNNAYDALNVRRTSKTVRFRKSSTGKLIRDVQRRDFTSELVARARGLRAFPSLSIEHIETRNSIEVLLVGAVALINGLAFITKRVFDAREAAWKSEKAKWEAKKLELDVKDRLSLPKSAEAQAEGQIHQLLDHVEETKSITVFDLELDRYLRIEHTKTRKTPPPKDF